MLFVSVCINTCDRPDCLWKLLMSLCRQTHRDFEVVIVDDGDNDCSEDLRVKSAIKSLEKKGIDVIFHKNETMKGLAVSRNIASDLANSDIIVKLDDDHYCDSSCVEEMCNAVQKHPDAGCIGMVFPLARQGLHMSGTYAVVFGDPEMDKGWVTQQEKLYAEDVPDVIPCKMVRGLMLYRKDPDIRHDERLSPIAHREDSIFSMEYLRKGYKNYVCVRGIAWHFQAPNGGCRRWGNEEADRLRKQDGEVWKQYVKETQAK